MKRLGAGTLAAWQGLDRLEQLILSGNPGIVGTLPAEWPQMFPLLQEVWLQDCSLTGTLPLGKLSLQAAQTAFEA